MSDLRLLNSVFLKNRVTELGIRQWWLAEQVGVDRKTVIRWIQGQVRSIQLENILALAKILNCSLNDLSVDNLANQMATAEDQKRAASLLAGSSLLDKLGPVGEWPIIEGLLKAAIVPNLPVNILAELYNQLTVASWRQSKIDESDLYNQRALELSRNSGDKSALAKALLSQANIFSWRGKTKQSIQTYNLCLELAPHIDAKTIGSIYSNLGAVLYEAGDLAAGESFERKSLEVFGFHGRPMNVSISWCHIAMIQLQRGEISEAEKSCSLSGAYANKDEYLRGIEMCKLILAECLARQGGSADAAIETMKSGMSGFASLGIEEGLNYEFAGRISRLVKDDIASMAFIRKGISLSADFPLALAALYFESALTSISGGFSAEEATKSLERAAKLYGDCEAPLRVEMVNAYKKRL